MQIDVRDDVPQDTESFRDPTSRLEFGPMTLAIAKGEGVEVKAFLAGYRQGRCRVEATTQEDYRRSPLVHR
jgi:hypothetical protein